MILSDGSTIEVRQHQYRFTDGENRTAQTDALRLAASFTRTQALYCHWPNTANLYHHAMKLLEGQVIGALDDGEDPLISRPEACARWPELEAELRNWAVNADPGDDAFHAVTDDIRRKAGAILAGLPQDTLVTMKTELAERLRRRDPEKYDG